ncbi:hypothetical protein D9Q98_006817 [Chlorella vulgaris]|uniref:Ferritin n=1 Tax=Chlorella vulgaris TaxID=3077 RepID=A0A9D4TJ13_CHLVU|nr:hypothetical protein D9Q98_006817 [Chlorella vulgaris]
MTSVVAPAKDQPTSQQEGRFKESFPGVSTLPLDEVKARRYGETEKGEVNRGTFVRVDYSGDLEQAVNGQIDYDWSVGYALLAMAAYFDRDTVSLPGIAKYFRALNDRAWSDANRMMRFQNMRGGKVRVGAVAMPDSDYFSPEKGDALYAFEVALALEKLRMDRLKALHSLADATDDFQAQDFIESEMSVQAGLVKELGDRACELKRVGTGHGVFHFDERIDSL